ncbi:MAG TPA: SPOR domain-containing protein [Desulfuromonadales bacterium]|nr:SPOR domain-containing protein [Desulfuromonadales bacterium]
MRIDYSEPKKSYTSTPPLASQGRPRKESSGGSGPFVIIVASLVSLSIGFGSGWMLSQRSAKKGFKAAMEQQSLENSPDQSTAKQVAPKPAAAVPSPAAQPPQPGGTQPPSSAPTEQPPVDQPLSFYKTLPSGQKNNALGSGINTQDKTAKQPLQAVIPSNVTKQSQPQSSEDSAKPAADAPAKPAGRQDTNGLYTVQVSSYSLKSEAEIFKSKLAAKGYNVYITESHLGDKGTWYRVRVGKRLDQEAAKELATKLGKGAMAIPDKD